MEPLGGRMDSIDICNMAIGFVGGSSITSLVDETLEAEQCGRYYDIARKFCLEGRDWTFAARTQRLAPEAVPLSSEFSNSFVLPVDCLVVRVVAYDPELKRGAVYQKNENRILANSSVLYVKFTQDVTNTTRFSPSFTTAVAHKLAEFLAPVLTGDKNMKRTLMQESEYLVDTGGAIDGMQGSPKRVFASRLLGARFGRGSRYGLGSTLE